LMDKLEKDDIPGLLMLVDFEKAVDTVEWPFIEEKPNRETVEYIQGLSKRIVLIP
jgi:hypothetical protein